MPSVLTWPAVSVVVTCYNLERYLRDALLSVRAQDYPGPVEIILVDDASSDDSLASVADVPGVTLVTKATNGGVLLATIDGVERASHDLIFLLDGDDMWEASKLRLSVAALNEPGVAFVTHSLSHIDSCGQSIVRSNRVEAGLGKVPADGMSGHLRESILTMRDDVWLGSAFGFRRSLVDWNGFSAFVAGLPDPANCYQDWPLAYWIAAHKNVRLSYVAERLFGYRLHGANHSGDAGSASRAARNFRRAANTLDAMIEIAGRFGVETGVASLRQRATSYRYLSGLYGGGRLSSLPNFARSAPSFAARGLLAKETIRLFAIMLLGPDRFAQLAARRAGALDLKTS
ncbi:glycosyltransferase [Sphingomonas jaspsi]|uniref:glycosyltransferase n=1 Tax=Sphingomonas jaspsi TaxID=392409 RepID=UPI0004B1A2C7|nr:glycosyltransferase [Sphingomonas jaspsi]